jgi:ATP-dependent protease HslVU (ClpYQ) peptidase subunit
MTLVLAIKARDGIVLASDSQATSGTDAMRTRGAARKLDDLHGRIAFGCSGSSGLRQRVVAGLREQLSPADCREPIERLRHRIHAIVNPLQQQARAEHVDLPGTHPPCLELLFVGVTDGRSWIYEIAGDGKEEEHELAEAIGGARHYAIHGMVYHQHLELPQRPLKQVRLAAYRVLLNTILADGTGAIGVPVQMYEARESGVRLVTLSELKVMHDTLNALKEQERDLWVPSADEEATASEEPVDGVLLERPAETRAE